MENFNSLVGTQRGCNADDTWMHTYHEHRAWCRRWEARRGLYCWLYTWKLYWARRVWFASAANYSRSLFRSRLSSSSWTLKQGRSNVCSDMRFHIEFLRGTTRGWLFGNDFELNLSMTMSVWRANGIRLYDSKFCWNLKKLEKLSGNKRFSISICAHLRRIENRDFSTIISKLRYEYI